MLRSMPKIRGTCCDVLLYFNEKHFKHYNVKCLNACVMQLHIQQKRNSEDNMAIQCGAQNRIDQDQCVP